MHHRAATLSLALICAPLPAMPAESAPGPSRQSATAARAVAAHRSSVSLASETLGRVTSSFVENRGQAHPSVLYYGAGPGGQVSLTTRGVVFAIGGERVALEFVGASADVRPVGLLRTGANVSIFRGSPAEWRSGIATFAEVRYHALWPGVDLHVRSGDAAELKYEFVVAPGADPRRIRLAYRSARPARLTETGEVEVPTASGVLREKAPVSYQEAPGRRTAVPSAFRATEGAGGLEFGFTLAGYDTARPLVVDPEIVFSGLLGGTKVDTVTNVSLDASGDIYLAGSTDSAPVDGFPVEVGPDLEFASAERRTTDAFVAKISADGSRVIYCGYIGGERFDFATDVAVDGQGNAYVVGTTYSNPAEDGFPVVVGPYLTFNQGFIVNNQDVFVSKVSADGSKLLYSGYIGTSLREYSTGIAVDAQGSAYLLMLGKIGPTDPQGPRFDRCWEGRDGVSDAFIYKVRPDGTGLTFRNYFYGEGLDVPLDLAVDSSGAVYVTGTTSSASLCYTARGPKLTIGGERDAFVGKLKPDLSAFEYLGYIGGAGTDIGMRVSVDSSGAAYVVGLTRSTEATFPVAVGPDLTHNSPEDGFDAFVAKVRPDGTGLVYCGYVGGSADDGATAVAVDSRGRAFVTGYTRSTEASFPLAGAIDGTYNGGTGTGDAFVAQVSADGRSLAFSTYLGGTHKDTGLGIEVDRQGAAVVVGVTESDDGSFPTTAGSFNATAVGGSDVFVVKIQAGPAGPPPPSVSGVAKEGKFLVVTGANFAAGARVLVNGTAYKAKLDPAGSTTRLKSKKAGKVVMPGDMITVRNPDGSVSNAVAFGG